MSRYKPTIVRETDRSDFADGHCADWAAACSPRFRSESKNETHRPTTGISLVSPSISPNASAADCEKSIHATAPGSASNKVNSAKVAEYNECQL